MIYQTMSLLALTASVLYCTAGQAQQTGPQHHHEAAPAHSSSDSSEPNTSQLEHVPPDPPANEMGQMPHRAMVDMMAMDDTAAYGKLLMDQLEWRGTDGTNRFDWDATAFYGTDYNKLWIRTEGARSGGRTEEARAEVLWDRIIGRWWSSQIGLRHDFGPGPSLDWLALGVQGLAPYFFEIEATAYIGDAGRTAGRLKTEYEWLFTQRLILQPEIELNVYGKDDPAKGVMSGISDTQVGLRLRYEIRREFAPYMGVTWVRHLGKTADRLRAAGENASDFQAVVGLRIWL